MNENKIKTLVITVPVYRHYKNAKYSTLMQYKQCSFITTVYLCSSLSHEAKTSLRASTYHHTLSTPCPKKNIPDIFDCNLKKDYQILIIFDIHISDLTGDQMAIQFSTAHTVCFCTTWRNKTNKISHFYPIPPVRVFPGSAETDIW